MFTAIFRLITTNSLRLIAIATYSDQWNKMPYIHDCIIIIYKFTLNNEHTFHYDLESGDPKCATGFAQLNNLLVEHYFKKKTIFLLKVGIHRMQDSHLNKVLIANHKASLAVPHWMFAHVKLNRLVVYMIVQINEEKT